MCIEDRLGGREGGKVEWWSDVICVISEKYPPPGSVLPLLEKDLVGVASLNLWCLCPVVCCWLRHWDTETNEGRVKWGSVVWSRDTNTLNINTLWLSGCTKCRQQEASEELSKLTKWSGPFLETNSGPFKVPLEIVGAVLSKKLGVLPERNMEEEHNDRTTREVVQFKEAVLKC